MKEVKLYLSQGPLQWAGGERHVGHMWESFLIPCLQHGDMLIIPTLEAIQKIWSKPLPESIISTQSFQDSAQNILRNVEKVLEKIRPKDKEEETVATNHEGGFKQNEDEKKYNEQMRKLMKPPPDAPINNAILLKFYGMVLLHFCCLVLITCRGVLIHNHSSNRHCGCDCSLGPLSTTTYNKICSHITTLNC